MFYSVVYLLNNHLLKRNKNHGESFSLQALYT